MQLLSVIFFCVGKSHPEKFKCNAKCSGFSFRKSWTILVAQIIALRMIFYVFRHSKMSRWKTSIYGEKEED